MEYIQLTPIKQREIDGSRLFKSPRIYAIDSIKKAKKGNSSVGLPPYYEVTRINEQGKPVLRELNQGSDDYNRVQKWVGDINSKVLSLRKRQRRVLTHSDASCRITLEQIPEILIKANTYMDNL